MKKTIIAVAMLFSLQGKAQMADTTEIRKMQESIDRINLNLDKAHKQYRTGTVLIVVGLALNGAAVLAGNDNDGRGFIAGLGGIAILGGGLVHIDSHKYIGRTRK
jgi:hypothetical protein